jgi:two-component system phosphate regulon sensor histidine kinase PhoR
MSLTARITLISALTITVALLVVAAIDGWILRRTYVQQVARLLETSAELTANELQDEFQHVVVTHGFELLWDDLADRLAAASGMRVTIVSLDGIVLADSHVVAATMENHADREEIQQAVREGRGAATRQSDSTHSQQMYVARRVDTPRGPIAVVRVALPLAPIDTAVRQIVVIMTLVVAAAALIASAVLALLTRYTLRPIRELTRLAVRYSRGDLSERVPIRRLDEVGTLAAGFNRMADGLARTIEDISSERNRLASILDTVTDGLVILEADGRVIAINPPAVQLLGTSPSAAMGYPFSRICHDYELIALSADPTSSSRYLELGAPKRQVRAGIAPLQGTNGQRVLLLQDVTELRRVETVRRDFIANVSHELRTPIAAMKAIVETLEDGALDDQDVARSFVTKLGGEVDEISALVEQLLELSRIESGAIQLHLAPSLATDTIVATTERLRPLAERAGLSLYLAVPPHLPEVLVDLNRLPTILTNLIHNSIKFTPPGGSVIVRAIARDEDVVVEVADTGIGISSDALERVFERFFKADRSRSGGGAGLGLAITKHLVQAHGGTVWVRSDASGSIFSFTLRRAHASSPVPIG